MFSLRSVFMITSFSAFNAIRSLSSNLSMSLSNKACFGAGCYWGTEKFFLKDFGKEKFPGSIKSGAVGFMGPTSAKKNPTCNNVFDALHTQN